VAIVKTIRLVHIRGGVVVFRGVLPIACEKTNGAVVPLCGSDYNRRWEGRAVSGAPGQTAVDRLVPFAAAHGARS